MSRSGRVLLIASAATFLAFLDVTVVNVGFPDLERDFPRTSFSTLSWVVTVYGVAFAAMLTPAGRLADVVGRRRVFLTGVTAFMVTSGASAVAPSVAVLIVARALQGAAAAMMIPAALGMVLAAAPAERRSRAIGLWGAAGSIAAAAGPTVGGLLVEAFSWRAVFVVNVPIALAAIVAGARSLPDLRPTERRLPDLPGTVMLTVGLGLLVVGVTKAGDWGWGSAATIRCLIAGGAVLSIALLRALGHPAPAIETRLWRNRFFAAANVTSLIFGAAVYAWLLLGVLFLTAVWHYSVLEAGLAVSPGAFTSALAAVVAGRVADRRGQRLVVASGALLLVAVAVWIERALTATPQFLELWLPAGLLSGAALGAALTGLASAAATSVPETRFAAGTGLNLTARQLGGAFGVAVLAAILEAKAGAGMTAFRDVYAFCAAAGGLAAASALLLDSAPATTASAPASAATPSLTGR